MRKFKQIANDQLIFLFRGILHRVVCMTCSGVSAERTASIFRVIYFVLEDANLTE